jgi:hypothetical protein
LQYLQEVLNKTFQLHHIPDILKIGILFPVFKNKGDFKNAKNYRGITVTPYIRRNLKNKHDLKRAGVKKMSALVYVYTLIVYLPG